MYRERFPNRHVPAYQTFAAIHRRLGETGTISVARPDAGRPRAVRDPDMEDDILDHFHNAPTTNTRAVTSVIYVSRMTVWRVLHKNLQYPFHIQRVQSLNIANYPRCGPPSTIHLYIWHLDSHVFFRPIRKLFRLFCVRLLIPD